MKYFLIFIAILFGIIPVEAQISGTYKIQGADTVKMLKPGGATELQVMNKTDTVPGVLLNIGNGITQFRHALIKINDSTFLVGFDTLKIHSTNGGIPSLVNGNGTVINGDSVNLGGSLTKLTIINGAGNAFSITNIGNYNLGAVNGNILLSGYGVLDAVSGLTVNSSGGSTVINPNGGNVGINMILPQYPLDVNGSIRTITQSILDSSNLSATTAWVRKWVQNGHPSITFPFLRGSGDSLNYIFPLYTTPFTNPITGGTDSLGIGTQSPEALLDVSGRAIIDTLGITIGARYLGNWHLTINPRDTNSIMPKEYTDSLINSIRQADTVTSISLLEAYNISNVKSIIVTDSLRGGLFIFVANALPDSGTIFPAWGVGSGYWQRVYRKDNGLNVCWFGAIGNGTNDDTRPIQLAVNAVSKTSVTKVFFPIRDYFTNNSIGYKISSTITVGTGDIQFVSPGWQQGGLSWIKSTGSNFTMFNVTADGVGFNGIGFVGDGGALLSPVPTVNAILYTGDGGGNADASVNYCLFLYINQACRTKARNVNFFDNEISNSRFGFYVDTIAVTGQMRGFVVSRNRFHTVGKFQATDACIYSSTISNFQFQINDNYVDGQGNGMFAYLKADSNVDIKNNSIAQNRSYFIELDTCSQFNIVGNSFVGNSSPVTPSLDSSCIIIRQGKQGNIISNDLQNIQLDGIDVLASSSYILISGNNISNYSMGGAGAYGIKIDATSSHNDFLGNKINVNIVGISQGGDISNLNGTNNLFFNNTYHPIGSAGGDYVRLNTNFQFNGTAATEYILMTGTTTGTQKLTMQAGAGSDTYGGAISLYGNQHATHPGDVRVGLSGSTLSSFYVNRAGLGETGINIFYAKGDGTVHLFPPLTGSTTNNILVYNTTDSTVKQIAVSSLISGVLDTTVIVTSNYTVNNSHFKTTVILNATSGTITLLDPTQPANLNRYFFVRPATSGQTVTLTTPVGQIENSLGSFSSSITITSIPFQCWKANGTNWILTN